MSFWEIVLSFIFLTLILSLCLFRNPCPLDVGPLTFLYIFFSQFHLFCSMFWKISSSFPFILSIEVFGFAVYFNFLEPNPHLCSLKVPLL